MGQQVKLEEAWNGFMEGRVLSQGTQSSPVSDWVVFLVDFSGERGFLFLKTGIRVGDEWN